MKIAASRLSPCTVADGRSGLALTLIAEDGTCGEGEATPLCGYSPDDLATARAALTDVHSQLAPLALDPGAPQHDPRDDDITTQAHPAHSPQWSGHGLAVIKRALTPCSSTLLHSPSARFAVEAALVDLLGRRVGVPAHVLLGASAASSETIPTNALLSSPLDRVRTLREARMHVERGFGILKAKVGRAATFSLELEVLSMVRQAFPEAVLRLDANGAWTVSQARTYAKLLEPLRLEYIEEPTRGQGLLELSDFPVPWAADESLTSAALRPQLLACRSCVAWVIKPALHGGLLASRDLALTARTHGKDVIITHMMDGGVARAAAAALALSLPPPHAACGLTPDSDEPFPTAAAFARAAAITPTRYPGLGLMLDNAGEALGELAHTRSGAAPWTV